MNRGENIPELIATAYRDNNAAKKLLVKGKVDFIAQDSKIVASIAGPDVPALEAIGGTGDTITGLVSAFVYAGFDPQVAGIVAAKANRTAGQFAQATPATKVRKIIDQFPIVFKEYLRQWTREARGQRNSDFRLELLLERSSMNHNVTMIPFYYGFHT